MIEVISFISFGYEVPVKSSVFELQPDVVCDAISLVLPFHIESQSCC